MRGLIHHLDLTVRDPAASLAFYDAVLSHFGYRRTREDERGFDWEFRSDDGTFTSIGVMRASITGRERAHDRYSPGLHHVAWTAGSRADVDELYDLLRRIGATILEPPAGYPQYGAGYYALFFADPDGLKLEYVFQP